LQAFVINLQRSADRRDHILRQLSRTSLEYHLVEATDGRLIDTTDVSLASPDWMGRVSTSPGVLGCSLSHLRVYEAVLEAGVDLALVLEDDIVLPPDISPLVEEAASHMELAEVLLLRVSAPDPPCQLSRKGVVQLSSGHLIAYPMDLINVAAGVAYVITAEACLRMRAGLLPVRVPADDWFYFHSQGILDRVRCVAPLPIRIDPSFGSTINHGIHTWRDYIYRALEHVPVQPAKALVSLRRERYYKRATSLTLVEEASPYWLPQAS
jgi:glycosyl transferase family 25